jgi:hypothetical protein
VPATAAISWPEALVFKRELVTPEVVRVVAAREVVVALEAVKFCKVVDPLKSALVKVAKSEVREPMMPVFALISVVEARPET